MMAGTVKKETSQLTLRCVLMICNPSSMGQVGHNKDSKLSRRYQI